MSSETYLNYRVFGSVSGIQVFTKLISDRREALSGAGLETMEELEVNEVVGQQYGATSKQSMTSLEFEAAETAAKTADVVAFVGVIDQDADRSLARVFNGIGGETGRALLEDTEFVSIYSESYSDYDVIEEMWSSLSSIINDNLEARKATMKQDDEIKWEPLLASSWRDHETGYLFRFLTRETELKRLGEQLNSHLSTYHKNYSERAREGRSQIVVAENDLGRPMGFAELVVFSGMADMKMGFTGRRRSIGAMPDIDAAGQRLLNGLNDGSIPTPGKGIDAISRRFVSGYPDVLAEVAERRRAYLMGEPIPPLTEETPPPPSLSFR